MHRASFFAASILQFPKCLFFLSVCTRSASLLKSHEQAMHSLGELAHSVSERMRGGAETRQLARAPHCFGSIEKACVFLNVWTSCELSGVDLPNTCFFSMFYSLRSRNPLRAFRGSAFKRFSACADIAASLCVAYLLRSRNPPRTFGWSASTNQLSASVCVCCSLSWSRERGREREREREKEGEREPEREREAER